MFSGAGFLANEVVTLRVVHAIGTPTTGADHDPWTVVTNRTGRFVTSWRVCTDNYVGELLATADGASSGRHAQVTVTGSKRSPQLPDVPTVAESGVPGYEAYVWLGLLAPKGTPQAIIDRVNRDVLEVLKTNEVKSYMDTAGIEIAGSTPAEFGTFFRAERDQWAKIVRETGAKAD